MWLYERWKNKSSSINIILHNRQWWLFNNEDHNSHGPTLLQNIIKVHLLLFWLRDPIAEVHTVHLSMTVKFKWCYDFKNISSKHCPNTCFQGIDINLFWHSRCEGLTLCVPVTCQQSSKLLFLLFLKQPHISLHFLSASLSKFIRNRTCWSAASVCTTQFILFISV